MFATYADQHPSNPWGHYMLGLSSWKAGDLDRAERAFVRANELDPKHVKTLLNLARVQPRPGQAEGRVRPSERGAQARFDVGRGVSTHGPRPRGAQRA